MLTNIILAAVLSCGECSSLEQLTNEGFQLQEVREDGTRIFSKPITSMNCSSGSCSSGSCNTNSNSNRGFPRLQKLLPINKENNSNVKDPNEPPKPIFPAATSSNNTDCCKELELKIQRINGEIEALKRENDLTKTYIDSLDKKIGEVTIKTQNLAVNVQNIGDNEKLLVKRIDNIEANLKSLSGAMKFRLQFDPVSGTVRSMPVN